ncbi:IS1380 family transposase [Rhodovibrio sodomensis]|uniref:IS1380 family transposase n=1 Tax=Rhodovibrio sodomensis TaxID=1088 RepID=A0ABS1DMB4_9PROT|nr:IS1380 family transposase [Rhodovibrio sodomensis]MBK1670520.1 IS1380 family transposase [Rhodovibrio sodomensis]
MAEGNQEQLRFHPVEGCTVRAEFNGGAMSSDFGPMLLRGVDRQIGLSDRLAAAIADWRHSSYTDHELGDLLAYRAFLHACGYADGNDADALSTDPVFQLALDRYPLAEKSRLASGSTFCRLENGVSKKDIYRLGQAFVDQFIASYAQEPEAIVLDLDHTVDPTHGQQAFSFYNHHYRTHCFLPLAIFEGQTGRLVTAVLRPGKTPTGAENASILRRVLDRLRVAWPDTHILVRGDGHFANPEIMSLIAERPNTDFLLGLTGNNRLYEQARPDLDAAAEEHTARCAEARRMSLTPPQATRHYCELSYAAGSWPITPRVILKAEVMAAGRNPRFVVTSLQQPEPEYLYAALYTARGQDENFIKHWKNDLFAERTSDRSFLANHLRLFYACAAYVLHHALRTQVLAHTELARAEPGTVIVKLFKRAVRVVPKKRRVDLHLPTSCPVKGLLHRASEILYRIKPPPPRPA